MTIRIRNSSSVILWDPPLIQGVFHEIMMKSKRRKTGVEISEIIFNVFKNLLSERGATLMLC